jgi:M6 family metalloprotease-like protein
VLALLVVTTTESKVAFAHPGHDGHENVSQKAIDISVDINVINRNIRGLLKMEGDQPITPETKAAIKERGQLMKDLLKEDPKLFFVNVLDEKSLSGISKDKSLDSYIEKKSTYSGVISVTHIDMIDGDGNDTSYYSYRLHTKDGKGKFTGMHDLYLSKDVSINSGTEVTVNGYMIGGVLAADTYNAENFIADPQPVVGATGLQRVIAIPVDFNDSGTRPFTRAQAVNILTNSQFKNFETEASYGNVSWTFTVAEWTKLNRNAVVGSSCGAVYDNELAQIVASQGININNYDRVIIMPYHPTTLGGGCSSVGKGPVYIGGTTYQNVSISWVSLQNYNSSSLWGSQPFTWTNLDYLLAHELGHALGLQHAKGWNCGSVAQYGSQCYSDEYGNFFDTMGNVSRSLHYNAFYKNSLGWVSAGRVLDISQSGRYTINNLESATGTVLANIGVSAPGSFATSTAFALEYRRPVGFDANIGASGFWRQSSNGLFINQVIQEYSPYTRILDTTPSSSNWIEDTNDASLLVGNTFTDPGRGVTITTVSTTTSSITFDVTFGPKTCTRYAPKVSYFYPPYFDVMAGDTFSVSLGGYNYDSFGCGASDIRVTPVSLPSGWTSTSTPLLTAPDLSANTYLEITPAHSSSGTYNISVKLENVQTGMFETRSFSVNILPAPFLSSANPDKAVRGASVTLSGGNLATLNSHIRLTSTVGGSYVDVIPTNLTVNSATFTVPNSIAYGQYNLKLFSNGYYTNSIPFEVGVNPAIVLNSITPGTCSTGPNSIKLGWSAPINPTAVSYKIYRNGVEIQNLIKANLHKPVSYTDGELAFGTQYSYYIREVYSNGSMSIPTATLSATTTNFCPVTDLSYTLGSCATNDADDVTLTFSTPTFAATKLAVYRDGVRIGTIDRVNYDYSYPRGATSFTYIDKNRPANTSSTYSVIAEYTGEKIVGYYDTSWSGVGSSTPATVSLVTPGLCVNTYLPPQDFNALVDIYACENMPEYADAVWVRFNSPQNKNNLSHFNIYRDGGLVASTTRTEYADRGLSPNTTYSYYAAAVYASISGYTESVPSAVQSPTTLPVCGSEESLVSGNETPEKPVVDTNTEEIDTVDYVGTNEETIEEVVEETVDEEVTEDTVEEIVDEEIQEDIEVIEEESISEEVTEDTNEETVEEVTEDTTVEN